MTRDEFDAKYRLHKVVAEGGPGVVRSYFGRSQVTKTAVLAHFLSPAAKPNPQEALARIGTLGPEDRDVVLETCEVDGAVVVVTRFIWDFTTFDAWLASRGQPPARAQPPAPAPGEFTRLFGSPAAGSPPGGSQPGTAPPAGEFTQLFGQRPAPPGPSPPSRERAPRYDLSDAPTERLKPGVPGEFTRMFKAPSETPPPPAPPAPGPAPSGPGEFTRLFGAPATPGTGTPPPPAWPPLSAPRAEPPSPSQPVFPEPSMPEDDLAQRLARGAEPPPAAPTAPRAEPTSPVPQAPTAPGDFTRMFGSVSPSPQVTGPGPLAVGPGPGAPPPPPGPGPQAGPSGPSTDYLARLRGVAPAPPTQGPPSAPKPPQAAGGSAFTRALQRISVARAPVETAEPGPERRQARAALPVVLIASGVLVVLGLAIVLYFLLTAR